MLSQTAEHALRAMLHLARSDGGGYQPSRAIASALGAPANYLAKTLGQLVSAGLLVAVRGPGGGMRLARPAGAITVAEILAVFEWEGRGNSCPMVPGCGEVEAPCDAHRLWRRLVDEARVPFQQTTLADLVGGNPDERE